MLMMWWVIPFFVTAFLSYPFRSYLSSYLHFLIAFGVPSIFALILNAVEAKYRFWKDTGHWGRLGWLTGSYAVVILIVLIITLTLDSYGLIGYFGGDPEGSFGMLYLPSFVFYLLVGAIASSVLTVREAVKRHHAQ